MLPPTILVVIQESCKTKRSRLQLLLRLRMMVRERNYLTRDALISPLQSPWHVMYAGRADGSFVATVSIPPRAFDELLKVFSRYYVVASGLGRRGRPPALVVKHAALACVLHYYTAAVEAKTLCELFGIPPATLSRVLKKAGAALDAALSELLDAQVRFPSKQQQRQWSRQVQAKKPLLEGVWGFVDGKNYRVQSPTDADLQNAHYNGRLHSVLVTGTLCYGVDGTLVWGRHNLPGSWNDGETSRQLQLRLADPLWTVEGCGVVADSAFPVSRALFGRIRTPLKDGDLERAHIECRLGLVALSNAITSVRQAAEWGMGSAERCYRRLQLRLPFDPQERGRLLRNIYRLYNFRVRKTGISQIRSVFAEYH
ncbi:hypothetical protein F444_19048 [Phytophthora nicotianae P1976]|uniref:DDE Tnp4 domain-containing protein n=1 Tax=Phytophthora nicotianae P1976 TaxID=1317066 RepID=A0A080Z9C2_PHYNI|nr:hypothetical protein F444_19048 [Phytophthora nicotianae P1976]